MDATEDVLEPGTRVGDFVVERVLGTGGFGTVYAATNPLISRRVAIKVLERRYAVQPGAVSRFLREARVVNEVHHKNIVDISAFDQLPDGRHYHVMEYLKGETLERLLERRGRLPLPDALPLFAGTAAALDAVHRRGIAHRDLKPANIFVVDDDGELIPKVIDFGIAKLSGTDQDVPKTRSGALIGTPRYMSPEQARGKDVDPRSDVYSFGLVVYEVLTGSPAFEGADDLEILLKHTSQRPEPPSSHCPDLPAGVDAIVLAMLEKDADKRPSSLVAVVRALERLANGEPVGDAELDPRPVADAALAPSEAEAARPRRSETLTLGRRAPTREFDGSARKARGLALALAIAVCSIAGVAWSVRAHKQSAAPVSPAATTDPPTVRAPAKQREAITLASVEATSERVTIEIAGTPKDTLVLGAGGVVLGRAPGTLVLPRSKEPLELTLRRAGYVDQVRAVVPNTSKSLQVPMHRVLARRRPGPDDSENPFK